MPVLRFSPQEEDTLNTSSAESARLKDIPVPVSLPQDRSEGTNTFTLPAEHMHAPAPWVPPKGQGAPVADDDPVDWDMDPAGFRFLRKLNAGEIDGYAGPAVDEAAFEKMVDRFEKAVKADVLPELQGLRAQLAKTAPAPEAVDAAYEWWVQRRKVLAMPLVRGLRPAPDPEDPDTTGVAFRPREKEGVKRLRSNNKKTYNLMASLHDEFGRLKALCELMKRRERLKLDFHQASGEYTEAAHRTLLHRLHKQRTGQGGRGDEMELEGVAAAGGGGGPSRPSGGSHKKGAGKAAAAAAAMGGGAGAMGKGGAAAGEVRSHHKKRHPGPGRPPKEGMGAGGAAAAAGVPGPSGGAVKKERDKSHRPHRATQPPPPQAYVPGTYVTPGAGDDEWSYADVDSEEEAFSHMILRVDTARRDELVASLPRHLRALPDPPEEEAVASVLMPPPPPPVTQPPPPPLGTGAVAKPAALLAAAAAGGGALLLAPPAPAPTAPAAPPAPSAAPAPPGASALVPSAGRSPAGAAEAAASSAASSRRRRRRRRRRPWARPLGLYGPRRTSRPAELFAHGHRQPHHRRRRRRRHSCRRRRSHSPRDRRARRDRRRDRGAAHGGAAANAPVARSAVGGELARRRCPGRPLWRGRHAWHPV